jgi:Secretion system C-terminal sorting domain
MKKKIVYLSVLMMCVVVFSSYYTGVGISYGLDCTGAETALNNPMGCSISGTCHSHTVNQTWISVALELDSAGIATSHYTPGMTYSVKLSGINTTNDSLPIFGFQLTSIFGDTAAPVPANAGTWVTPYPFGTHYCPPQPGNFNLGIMEQNPALPFASGNGKLGSTYQIAINWTAPATGSGDVSFWGVLNAVNNDVSYGGDNYNNCHLVIPEWTQPVGVKTITSVETIGLTVLPNPARDKITITYKQKKSGLASINIFDVKGNLQKSIKNETQQAGEYNEQISVSDFAKGTYIIITNLDGVYQSDKFLVN